MIFMRCWERILRTNKVQYAVKVKVDIYIVQDLRFSQWHCWQCECYGMWRSEWFLILQKVIGPSFCLDTWMCVTFRCSNVCHGVVACLHSVWTPECAWLSGVQMCAMVFWLTFILFRHMNLHDFQVFKCVPWCSGLHSFCLDTWMCMSFRCQNVCHGVLA
jgi:hypothetical protein